MLCIFCAFFADAIFYPRMSLSGDNLLSVACKENENHRIFYNKAEVK